MTPMKPPQRTRTICAAGLAALAGIVCLPFAAEAHRQWMLPSATVLSGSDPWVTVDAAISNDLFYFEHFPMRLKGIGTPPPSAMRGGGKGPSRRAGLAPPELVITAPDGTRAEAENGAVGRYRTTFDVHLTKPGTYKMAVVNESLFASWKEGSETRRWRGTPEKLATEVPANAEGLKITQSQRRLELFVTAGKPTTDVLKPTGKGLELVPVTHPNDLVAGEAAKFRFTLDGQPAANMAVEIIPGGIRYRDKLNEVKAKTDADGILAFTLPTPGMYWLEAEVRDEKSTVKGATRRASYITTLEAQAP
ncbi:MAG TPA: DUF4198 domain-containing protein [Hyphomicrobiaceae bacterium]|nr:DUF4198 domain-containing protein [Hyphomicrobiaceae bacterium]